MIKGIEGRSGILRAFAALLMCILANGIKSYFGKVILHDTKKSPQSTERGFSAVALFGKPDPRVCSRK